VDGIPVFAWNMVLDDGGDATKIPHDRHPDLLAGSAASASLTLTGRIHTTLTT
jgi:S-adenosylhomocysteine hydrolase